LWTYIFYYIRRLMLWIPYSSCHSWFLSFSPCPSSCRLMQRLNVCTH
jgi:hypothetical protein